MDLIECPFCKDSGFDLIGLKAHFENGFCDEYEHIITPMEERRRRLKESQAIREALQDVLLDLQIILPMAKGYAHEHPVGNNKDKVYGVDAVIEQAQQALKEVS